MTRRQMLAWPSLVCLSACATLPPPSLDAAAAAQLDRVQAYLNGLQTLHARFLQIAQNGSVSRGTASMVRPGRLRLDYDPPGQASLVVDAGMLSLHDPATGATTTMPVSRTPLSMLLTPSISLRGPVTVTAFSAVNGIVTLTMVSTAHPAQGSLTLTLTDHPLTLRGLTLADGRGDRTRLELTDMPDGA